MAGNITISLPPLSLVAQAEVAWGGGGHAWPPPVCVAMIAVSKAPVARPGTARLNNIENCDIDLMEVVLN